MLLKMSSSGSFTFPLNNCLNNYSDLFSRPNLISKSSWISLSILESIIKFIQQRAIDNSIIMSSLQKKKLPTYSSSQSFEGFPRFTERISRKMSKQASAQEKSKLMYKQNLSFGLDYLDDEQEEEEIKNKSPKYSFNFLSKNNDLMNKSINTFTMRNGKKLINTLNKQAFSKLLSKQKKYDKSRKQQWMASTNQVSHLSKLNENQDRQMYRSRKKYLQNSVQTFVAHQQKNNCLSGVFPMSRINASLMAIVQKQTFRQRLMLVGGISPEMNTKFHLHEFLSPSCKWDEVKMQTAMKPQFNLSQHLSLIYKSCIFIIGGIAVIPSKKQIKNQRYNIPFISCFNLKTNKWNRINWSVYLRAHSGAVLGHYAIIDGGINEQEKNCPRMYAFDMIRTQSPFVLNNNSLALNHHKIVSTETFQQKNKSFIKIDGLICYGGKKQDGSLNGKAYLMGYDTKQMIQLPDKSNRFEWSELLITGRSPEPRYMHSMDTLQTKSCIFERKAYCAVLGGIGQNQNVLNDFWLLDLGILEWTQVSLTQTQCLLLQRGIAGHCTASNQNQLFIFGGYNSQRQFISSFWSISCENGYKVNKNVVRRSNNNRDQKYLSTSNLVNET